MAAIQTKDLTGAALDWAVAKCEGTEITFSEGLQATPLGMPSGQWEMYSTDWAHGGPIIEREAHNLFKHNGGTEWCCACNVPRDEYTAIVTADGPTPLIAAMRCYVASKLGDEVDVPEELAP